jgi:L-asparagine transporter-like permease
MKDTLILSIAGFGFGVIVIVIICCVAKFLFARRWNKKSDSDFPCPFAPATKTVCENYLDKRNEFWVYYGQIIIAVIIAVIVAVLLLTKSIDQSAGISLLSALGGFSIAKTANSSKQVPHRKEKDPE